jgi:predicted RNA-binding protein with PIN domain
MDRFALPDAMAFLDEQVSLATSYLSTEISCCFDALHASTSSDDFNSAHIDVQVWLWLATAHRMKLFQEWTSSYGILFGVTFFI